MALDSDWRIPHGGDWAGFVNRAVYGHEHGNKLPASARRRIESYFLHHVAYRDGVYTAFKLVLDTLVGYELVTANHR